MLIIGASLLGLAAGVGCDRNISPYDPAEEPRAPDLSRIFPAPEQAPAGGVAGPMGAGGPPAAEVAAGRPGAAVRGTVHLEGGGDAGGAVLFLIARPAGARGGPPLAVVRVPSPAFPFDFEIGPDDVMIPSMRFEGSITLTARLDGDGNASTQSEGDRSTASPVSVVPGDVGVELLLR
jgi:hypothetical protein